MWVFTPREENKFYFKTKYKRKYWAYKRDGLSREHSKITLSGTL
jgi:hypothetical protein